MKYDVKFQINTVDSATATKQFIQDIVGCELVGPVEVIPTPCGHSAASRSDEDDSCWECATEARQAGRG